MDSFSIGLSGLAASQRALDIIGNNISNAATEGYHRQRVDLRAAPTGVNGQTMTGGGVTFESTTRLVNTLLEQEILRQRSSSEQISRQLETLNTIEAAIGDLGAGGLGVKIDDFFNSLNDLSVHVTDPIYQQQAVTTASSMADQFRTFGNFFNGLSVDLTNEASITVEQINTIAAKIAQLNGTIQDIEINGSQVGNLRDDRDRYISDLAELVSIQTIERGDGITDISFNGIALVTGRTCEKLAMKLQSGDKIGVSIVGDDNYQTDIGGGKLGGIFSLKNEIIPEVMNKLNTLAQSIITQINAQHVQGLGVTGSFTELTGWEMIDQNIPAFEPPVTDGRLYIRVTDQTTGEISRQYIDIDSSGTLSDVAADLDALDNISASVIQGKLHIIADNGFKFDFLPGVLPTSSSTTLTGTTIPTVSGVYGNAENHTYTCTISGSGRVGVDTGLSVEVRNEDGDLIKNLSLSAGYIAGSKLVIEDGVSVSFSAGTVNDGENFTIEAIANSDPSGFLASAGMNTFFKGSDAASISLNENLLAHPASIATSLSADLNGNENIGRLAAMGSASWDSLDSRTCGDYFKNTITSLGHKVAIAETEEQSISGLLNNLLNQQDNISGVNVNEEAANLMVYERLFQASGKFIQTAKSNLDSLMDILS